MNFDEIMAIISIFQTGVETWITASEGADGFTDEQKRAIRAKAGIIDQAINDAYDEARDQD